MWKKLYDEAVRVQNSGTVSPFIEAGSVASAILTKQGNIYVGVYIDTASTLINRSGISLPFVAFR